MRAGTIIALLLSLGVAPVAAEAQRGSERQIVTRSMPMGSTISRDNWNGSRPGQMRQPRWGSNVNGHWYGGVHAPGGWNAYRRPARGWALPHYWVAPSFSIGDYEIYGLATPPQGHRWSRYYDDAVLIDSRGTVQDTVGGIDWDRDAGYYVGNDYAADRYDDAYDPGYSDGRRYPGHHAAPSHRGVTFAPPRETVQTSGYSSTSYSSDHQSGGYVSGGYWYPPTTRTVVTVDAAPVVTTTTTTEYIETTYAAPRKVWKPKKAAWKPRVRARPKPAPCACYCACR